MMKFCPLFTKITVDLRGVTVRSMLAWLAVLFLSSVMFFGGKQEAGWAAPAQHPLLQTIPTRPLEPTPSPPEPTPKKEEEGHKDKDDIPLVQPPANASPSQPPETEDGEHEDDTQPSQPPRENNDLEDTHPPSQPLEPEKQPSPTPVKPPVSSTELARPDLSLSTERSTPAASFPTSQPPTEPLALPSTSELLADRIGSLGWLYALALGLILILSGIFLVKRA